MTERERRPEGRDDDDDFHLGFLTSGTERSAEEVVTFKRTATPKPPEGIEVDAEFERQMALGRASMRKHRKVLAALAK